MQKFHDNVLVILNKFQDDTEEEITYLINYCKKLNVEALVSNMYQEGDKNTEEITKKIIEYTNKPNTKKCQIYNLEDDIITKIEKYCKNIYNAKEVVYTNNTKERLEELNKQYPNYRICISKTPASITDNKTILGYPKDFTMTVTDIKVSAGAQFIIILMGNVLTMPGLSDHANYLQMDIVNDEIKGIF